MPGFISIYECDACDRRIGLYFDWDEDECEDYAAICPVCFSEALTFVKDVEDGVL